VDEVAKKFPGEVVRIRYSFSRDWDGDPAIYFRVVLTDDARSLNRDQLGELTRRIRDSLVKALSLYDSEYSLYIPYFNYRTVSEQEQIKEPEWE
jgi:hypothetical protein